MPVTERRYPIVTLCGSTRFKLAFMEWNARLTLSGAVVFSVAMWSHNTRIEPTPEQKELLDKIHKAKIDASDSIFVLDVDGYIGPSTRSEIMHASEKGKAIRFLSREFPQWTEADCIFAHLPDHSALVQTLVDALAACCWAPENRRVRDAGRAALAAAAAEGFRPKGA